VTFSSAPDQICIPSSISNDGVVEETESFAVTLVSGDPAVQLTLPNVNVTIADSTGKYLFVHEAKDHCMDSMICTQMFLHDLFLFENLMILELLVVPL